MHKRFQIVKYLFFDAIAASLVWLCFFVYRKTYIEPITFGYKVPINFDENFIKGIVFIPIYWIIIYFLVGTYNNIYRKSRLIEFGQTLLISIIGTLMLFFTLLLDDEVSSTTV